MTLRLGVVGLGRAASSMLPSLAAHPHVTLAAAADLDPTARARFAADYGARTFENAGELCASGTVDAVYVATPHQCHVDDVATAAAYRKHVIVEKPMALTVEDCVRMIEATERAGTVLLVGHTHAFDPVVRAMREIIASGELGALRMVTSVAYTDFLYRPRRAEELDTAAGGGVFFNQVPHQIDIVRALDGGRIRTVKALAGVWDPARQTEGAVSALLEFEDGVAASLVYSGYDRFDTDELAFWIASSGAEKQAAHGAARRRLREAESPREEARLKTVSGYGRSGLRSAAGPAHQPHFGMLLASCEGGDMRPYADGVLVYDDEGVREVPLPPGRAFPNKDAVIDEFYDAVVHGTPVRHDGRWGLATVEAALALLRSARERREIALAASAATTR